MTAIPSRQTESTEVVGGLTGRGLVILCDHASNAMPAEYGTLGLEPSELQRHIAYDIGAAGVTRALAARLGVPAVLSRFSRLLIDPNRGDDDPTLIMRLSDGAIIPGNRHLDAAERERRLKRFWRPYHAAIDGVLTACEAAGSPPRILSIHTFTENWKGKARPWHAGILWEGDRRFAVPLLQALRGEGDLVVGENQPYPGSYEGDCCWQHGVMHGRPWAIVEIRQDLVADPAGQQHWASRLARLIESLDARSDLEMEGADGRP